MSKFHLNLNTVLDSKKELSSGGLFFSRKDIPEGGEAVIRILPPLESFNGNFYIKRVRCWINNKPYLSPQTVGQDCPIKAIVDEVRASKDANLLKLLEVKTFNVDTDYLLPILLLNISNDGKVSVIDDSMKIFDVPKGLAGDIAELVVSRHYQNESGLGLMDRVLGYNISITKKKTDRVKYTPVVLPNAYEMPEKYYNDMPDIIEINRKSLLNNDYLEKVARNYFYGEPMPDDSLKTKAISSVNTSTDSKNKEVEVTTSAEDIRTRLGL